MTEKKTIYEPYMPSVLTMRAFLKITEIGTSVKQNLEEIIKVKTESKCISEGYVKPKSIKILKYSAGKINGDLVEYHVTFECMICHPVEGMKVECIAKYITKAGIHAEVVDRMGNVPMVVYIARDHHMQNKLFETIQENMKIIATIVGVRFELNDLQIEVIGFLNDIVTNDNSDKKKPPLKIGGLYQESDSDSDSQE
jgi:hypothetical protein